MAQTRVWSFAVLLAVCMVGCSGSEYRFGNSKSANVVSLTVTPGSQTLTAAGQTAQLIATGTYSDSTSQGVTSQAQWTSSAASVATVSSGGMVTAVGTGSATISASFSGVTGSATITVDITGSGSSGRSLTSITIVPTSQTLMAVGEPGQFLAIGNYSAYPLTQDITNQATWISSDTAVAIVNSGGLATAVSTGTATISAESNGVVGSSVVTVTSSNTAHQLTGLTVIPATGTAYTNALGETVQYIAIGSFIGNPTTQDMTSQVSWISSDVRVATINAAGLATAVGSEGSGYPQVTAITAMATSNTSATITGTSDLHVGNSGVNNLPSLTVYMFGQGVGDVVNAPPPPNVIQCGPDYSQAGCTGHFTLNTPVTLVATPKSGSIFGGFSANCTPVPDACTAKETWVTSCTCQLTMGDNQTVGAVFDLQQ